jgi:hypothetical protein
MNYLGITLSLTWSRKIMVIKKQPLRILNEAVIFQSVSILKSFDNWFKNMFIKTVFFFQKYIM